MWEGTTITLATNICGQDHQGVWPGLDRWWDLPLLFLTISLNDSSYISAVFFLGLEVFSDVSKLLGFPGRAAYLHSPHDSLSSKIQTLQLTTSQPTNRLSTKRRTGKKIAGKLPTTSSLHFPSEPTHLTKHRTVVRNKSRKKSRHQFFFHINYWHIAHEKNLSPSLFLSIDTFSIRTTIADQT